MSDSRSCTCHPDEAPKPCQRHFGLSECFMAAEIERLRAALRELDEFATEELRNTAFLMSNPPKSSAAWNIRNRIRAALEERT